MAGKSFRLIGAPRTNSYAHRLLFFTGEDGKEYRWRLFKYHCEVCVWIWVLVNMIPN